MSFEEWFETPSAEHLDFDHARIAWDASSAEALEDQPLESWKAYQAFEAKYEELTLADWGWLAWCEALKWHKEAKMSSKKRDKA